MDWLSSWWPDRETWRYYNTFAPWLSAIATSLAAVTALFLARSGRRDKLKITAGLLPTLEGESGKMIFVTVANLGHRDVELGSIWWKFGRFKAVTIPINIGPMMDGSSTLPIRLPAGASATYTIPGDLNQLFLALGERMLAKKGTRGVKVTVVVFTPRGRFQTCVDRNLRQWFFSKLADSAEVEE